MDRHLNKSLDDLKVSSDALAVIGLWGLITVLLYNLFASKYIPLMFGIDESDKMLITMTTVMWTLVMFIGLIIRVLIRKAAKREKEGKSGWIYLAITLIILALYIYSLGYDIINFSMLAGDARNPLSSVVMDIANILIAGRLFYSGIKVKQLRKQMEKEAPFYAD